MDFNALRPPPSPVTVVGTSAASRGWQVGQILQATALDTAAAGGTLRLRIGGETLQVQVRAAVAAGQLLQVRVLSLQPELRLAIEPQARMPAAQTAVPPLTTPSATRADAQTAPLARTLLPAQEGATRLLMLLSMAARQTDLPPPIRTAVLETMKAMLPTAQAGDPARVRQAIRDSGLFLEARLAQAVATGKPPEGLDGDLKALLLRLAATLPEAGRDGKAAPRLPGEPPPPPGKHPAPLPQARAAELPPMAREAMMTALRQFVDGAVARIGLHQIAAVEQGPEAPRWLLELPMRNPAGEHDLVHMLLEREPDRGSGKGQRQWTAVIALDLPELGPVTARIAVDGEKNVSTWLWAESEETVDRIRAGLPRLQTALAARDLVVKDLGFRKETPPSQEPGPIGRGPSSLVDVEA